ncbi:hypothetical protein PP707_01150 [Acetobacter pasteurianus]|nr:hypothetical protein [Acetobacter pasteurianus]
MYFSSDSRNLHLCSKFVAAKRLFLEPKWKGGGESRLIDRRTHPNKEERAKH